MQVPFNDLRRYFSNNQQGCTEEILKVLSSGHWLLGEQTKNFSQEFASYCGAQHCLSLANGTDALELCLRAVTDSQDAHDNEVITVSNAGGYSSIACRLAGCVPVYADIDLDSQLISIDSIKNCLGPHVKAIILTHLYGTVVDVPAVRSMLIKNGYQHIKIIEDCAQSHGARIGEQKVGSLGDLSAFSFYPTKNLAAMGDAGAITTSDEVLFAKVKRLSQYGWSQKYHIDEVNGRNSRMDEIQAAILRLALPQLDHNNNIRRNIYRQYEHASKKLIPLRCSMENYDDQSFVAHLAVFRVPERRDEFINFCTQQGVNVNIHYPVLDFEQKAWTSLPARIDSKTAMINSKKAVTEIVTLPCFPYLTPEEIEHVCITLKNWDNL